MKKSTKVLAGVGLIMSLSVLTGCSDTQRDSYVYGPPESMTIKTEKQEDWRTQVWFATPTPTPKKEYEYPGLLYASPDFW